MSVFGYVHLSTDAQEGQKTASDPLELKFQAAVSHLMLAIGVEFSPSARALCPLNCGEPLQSVCIYLLLPPSLPSLLTIPFPPLGIMMLFGRL